MPGPEPGINKLTHPPSLDGDLFLDGQWGGVARIAGQGLGLPTPGAARRNEAENCRQRISPTAGTVGLPMPQRWAGKLNDRTVLRRAQLEMAPR